MTPRKSMRNRYAAAKEKYALNWDFCKFSHRALLLERSFGRLPMPGVKYSHKIYQRVLICQLYNRCERNLRGPWRGAALNRRLRQGPCRRRAPASVPRTRRSEERRVGKEWGRKCRTRMETDNKKNKKNTNN